MINFNLFKILTVKDSYQKSFRNLTNDEISGLCSHDSLLEKVHEELRSRSSQKDIDIFDRSLKVFQESGRNFSELYLSVFDKDSINTSNSFENLIFKQTIPSSKDFTPSYVKLAEKAGPESWTFAKECLYENNNTFHLETTKLFVKGFSLEDITSYERFNEAVEYLAYYVSSIWTSSDFTHILNLCKTNEKFVVLLLYPYFLLPLGKIIWTTLLPVLHFVSGSFSTFIQKVSDFLKKGTALKHKFQTLEVRKSVKFALKTSGIGVLALFSTFFTTTAKQGMISNGKLYNGLNGVLGVAFSTLRAEGSKVVYEMAKTISTFSSAALAGAVEPKQETMKALVDAFKK